MALEFGVFLQTYLPGELASDPAEEHAALMRDVEVALVAEEVGFKYVWVAEHHALTEYSHLSASEAFCGFLAAKTSRIHVGSGIWPMNPQTSHPVRRAEAAAMLDQLSCGRFEMGTGRGAGSHEVGTFNLKPTETRANWDNVMPEMRRMWEETEYTHDEFVEVPHNILPKPLGGGLTHPPLWLACGNTSSYQKAAELGLGAIGFNFAPSHEMEPLVRAYKERVAGATPIGQYVNDNVMLTSDPMVCLPDARDAREWAAKAGWAKFHSLIAHYHDSFPWPDDVIKWPDQGPDTTLDDIERMIDGQLGVIGDPAECREHARRYEAIGADQLVFDMGFAWPQEVRLEIIRTFGREVIPHFDTDPIHRTTRLRYGADAEAIAADPLRAAERFDSSTVGAAA